MAAILNLLMDEKKGGKKDGAQMQITKNDIKLAILETLYEQEKPQDKRAPEEMGTKQKLATQTQGGAEFARSGKEDRADANPELSNLERGILKQVDEFLLKLAQTPGVELNTYKVAIERAINLLQKSILKMPVAEGCGAANAMKMTGDDYHGEGRMAKSQLYRAAEAASELEQMINDGDELDAWVQAKITKATDYLSSVRHYLYYKNVRGER